MLEILGRLQIIHDDVDRRQVSYIMLQSEHCEWSVGGEKAAPCSDLFL